MMAGSTMKIKNKKSSSAKRYLLPILIIVALLVGGGYVYALSNDFFQESNNLPESSQLETQNDPIPDRLVPSDNTDKDKLGDTEEPEEGATVSITAANINDSILQVRGLISSVVSDGSCVLEISGGPEFKEFTAKVQPGPSSSTCQGFDVDTSELGSGIRTLVLKYVSDVTSSESAPREIEL